MSTTVKTGWLNDKNGEKFAPKTLISQVQDNDGVLLEDKLNNLTPTVAVDATLSVEGAPADAKATGDALASKADAQDVTDALAEKAPLYTYGTTDLTAGTSKLETGKLHFVYE
jgi:hypothetical protein